MIELTPNTALIGHDCWGDASVGDFLRSNVELNDYSMINELSHISKRQLKTVLNSLGDEAADYFRKILPKATKYENLIILTHVPPFREAGFHDGKNQDDNWAPHFVCGAASEPIREAFVKNSQCQGLLLVGHTHGNGTSQILPNLIAYNGPAKYGSPRVQRIFDIT